MAKFVQKLTESLPGPLATSISANPGAVMDQIDGFPVHSVEYSRGNPSAESHVDSIQEGPLDDTMFEAPAGYRLQDPFAGR
jgi:hypothetical protein